MRAIALSALVLVTASSAVLAQSLADVARKEEERRKQTPPAEKVYTNKDLGAVPPSSMPPPADDAKDADKGKDKDKDSAAAGGEKPADKTDRAADKSKADGAAKDQKYWHDRMQAALQAVDRDQTLADAMQSRINALSTDFVNRDDPAQRAVIARDRDRALLELDRLKKQIIDDKKAIGDIEE